MSEPELIRHEYDDILDLDREQYLPARSARVLDAPQAPVDRRDLRGYNVRIDHGEPVRAVHARLRGV